MASCTSPRVSFEHLAHFAGHVAGVLFFALDENFGGAENDFGAARSGNQTPFGEGALGGVDGGVHVGFGGFLEDADHVAGVGGIAVFERFSGRGFDPLAVDEILENFGWIVAEDGRGSQGVGCHDCSLIYECLDIDATGGGEGAARRGSGS